MGKGFTKAMKAQRDSMQRGDDIFTASRTFMDTMKNERKPTVPRMAGEVKSPSEGEEYRSVRDFRDFR